jgi:hypothetical protein
MAKKINEIGNTYGYLTVMEEGPRSADNRATWVCKCKCGNLITVTGKSLRQGHTKSCGCLKREVLIKRNMERGGGDLTGQRFGKLVVLEFDSWLTRNNGRRDRMWKCQCDCGNQCVVNHRYLRFGDTESCGCTKSRGNATIMRWLNEHHYLYQAEYKFTNFRTEKGHYYYFDFAIFNEDKTLNCLIEYQGNIHFKTGSGWNNQAALEDAQRRDKIKLDYCLKNNIPLFYITYTEIIEERLKEILSERIKSSD